MLHVKPQLVPSHVATESTGAAHGVHEVVPHDPAELLLTQAPLHRWNPVLQVKPHAVPSHVATLFAGTGHALHVVPQLATDEFATQAPLHVW